MSSLEPTATAATAMATRNRSFFTSSTSSGHAGLRAQTGELTGDDLAHERGRRGDGGADGVRQAEPFVEHLGPAADHEDPVDDAAERGQQRHHAAGGQVVRVEDRKSTRLNSSHI